MDGMKVWCKGLERFCANIKLHLHKRVLGNVESFFKNKLEHSPNQATNFQNEKAKFIYAPLVHPKENV